MNCVTTVNDHEIISWNVGNWTTGTFFPFGRLRHVRRVNLTTAAPWIRRVPQQVRLWMSQAESVDKQRPPSQSVHTGRRSLFFFLCRATNLVGELGDEMKKKRHDSRVQLMRARLSCHRPCSLCRYFKKCSCDYWNFMWTLQSPHVFKKIESSE